MSNQPFQIASYLQLSLARLKNTRLFQAGVADAPHCSTFNPILVWSYLIAVAEPQSVADSIFQSARWPVVAQGQPYE